EAATILCGTAREIAGHWIEIDLIVSLARDFRLDSMPDIAEAMLRRGGPMITSVQRLIIEGLIERPDSDDYALGLIALPRCTPRGFTLDQCFEADPGLKYVLLRMFDVEGNADTSLASAEKYGGTRFGWSKRLLDLCADGTLDRGVVLDKTLSALEKDWPQYRSGWFSRFHADLKPTEAEMAPRLERYLHLLGSRIPPTVSLALEVVSGLAAANRVEPPATVAALQSVMAKGNRQQVETALKLLQHCSSGVPALEGQAAEVACAALVNEVPALQRKVLQFIGERAAIPAVRQQLQRYASGIAASNRPLYQSLSGKNGADAPKFETSSQIAAVDSNPLAESRRLPPLQSLDDLIELLAHCFENTSDIEAFEQAVRELLSRLPLSTEDISRLGPVLKRAAKAKAILSGELSRLLIFACKNERLPPAPDPDGYRYPTRPIQWLNRRIDGLLDLAKRGQAIEPLAMPTHRRGYIAPHELIKRARAYRDCGADASEVEKVMVLLRLGSATDADRAEAALLGNEPFARALRYALGEALEPGPEVALFCAAARARHPRADDSVLLQRYGDLGPDGPKVARYDWKVESKAGQGYVSHELLVKTSDPSNFADTLLAVSRHRLPGGESGWPGRRSLCGSDAGVTAFFATLVPSDLEAFFAEGARQLGNNVDWWEARWQDRAFLEPMLDPTLQFGEMCTLALVCALAGKEPGQTALAIDCWVQAFRERRIDLSVF
ncbi:MAG: DUF6493 family protein, partial [Arenimonas sp.]